MIKKILIANRGEIALRIIRAAKELGIKTVIPFSDADRNSIPVMCAEESYNMEGNEPKDTYLRIDKLIEIAKKFNVDAIHPGYGFLSETPAFAKACEDNDIIFIGPSSDVISKMGDKIAAKKIVKSVKVPVVRGVNHSIASLSRAKKIAEMIGYPVIVKAVSGGGGKGMRVVTDPKHLELALESASREAAVSFNNKEVFIEQFIDNPRHVEVQIMADNYGNVVHLFERDCTIQRRHQKLLEESPSPVLSDKQRKKIGDIAVRVAKTLNYTNAGTVEFLLDGMGNLYFMEVNTRIQVEHPITEMITGIDLVKEQIKISSGQKLSVKQKDIKINGHAIECRINAEDVANDFLPSIGTVEDIIIPGGNGIRIDGAIKSKQEVSPYYDSMLMKVIAHGKTREDAIKKMQTALYEMRVTGVKTTITFFRKLLDDKLFRNKHYTTKFLETFKIEEKKNNVHSLAVAALAAMLHRKNKLNPQFNSDLKKKGFFQSKWSVAGRSEEIRVRRGW